jgi:hypothetical protein
MALTGLHSILFAGLEALEDQGRMEGGTPILSLPRLQVKRIFVSGEEMATPSAIPTIYKGVQLKSRLESQAAYLFDLLGWKWEYEPESHMLQNGLAYTPDFLLTNRRDYIECRGYETQKILIADRTCENWADFLNSLR